MASKLTSHGLLAHIEPSPRRQRDVHHLADQDRHLDQRTDDTGQRLAAGRTDTPIATESRARRKRQRCGPCGYRRWTSDACGSDVRARRDGNSVMINSCTGFMTSTCLGDRLPRLRK
jgi:hypothetical protein